MRKVVLEQSKEVTLLSEVSYDKYYGIQPSTNDYKGFILKRSYYGKDRVYLYAAENCTKADGWEVRGEYTLEGAIEYCLKTNWNVYEFDTHNELFKWLSE